MTHRQIQEDVISKYGIDICNGDKCKSDWSRTHAHIRERRVCKWKQANSIVSTFELLHEIGHIVRCLKRGVPYVLAYGIKHPLTEKEISYIRSVLGIF